MEDDKQDLASIILAKIAALPIEEQHEAIMDLVGTALKDMPLEVIRELQAEIHKLFDSEIPIVRSTLELIEGQVALREIAGDAKWR